ncbi:MAG: 3'-5' exonuclease [Burkholderiaceae bacterium]|nr:3'-5' exonuclease [Burkholderiaceae bacterium]
MIIRVLDVETSGLDPAVDEVIEIGFYDIYGGLLDPGSIRQSFVRPARAIPAVASAVHHITDADVKDAPTWADAWRMLIQTRDDGEELKFAAHMASFERRWLDPLIKADFICTWKAALRQWPDLESHSLQAIRYALKLAADPVLAMPPHRAGPDAYLCGVLLLELLKHQTVETLVAWSAEPAVFTKFDFGKFNGQPLSAADDGFLNWMLGKDFSEDWLWNVRRELARRAGAAEQAKADARKAYLDRAAEALPRTASVADLEAWYGDQAAERSKHGFVPGTDEYDVLVGACAARKKALLESGQPKFEPAGAPS